jgi:hypothetical protein
MLVTVTQAWCFLYDLKRNIGYKFFEKRATLSGL